MTTTMTAAPAASSFRNWAMLIYPHIDNRRHPNADTRVVVQQIGANRVPKTVVAIKISSFGSRLKRAIPRALASW